MYRGRYQLGQRVPLLVLCTNGSGTPGVPSAPPRLAVWDSSGNEVRSLVMPVMDRYGQAGLFHYALFLNADFGVGLYRAVYHWLLGSYPGVETDTFEVIPGGHADGAVVAMHFYPRPHADFVVQHLDSGNLVRGRNPTA